MWRNSVIAVAFMVIGVGIWPLSALHAESYSAAAITQYTGEAENDGAGQALAVGDLNNDGYDDMVIGASGTENGSVYIFYGGETVLDTDASLSTADAVINGESAGDTLGKSVAMGDFNGDNYDDLLIGANGEDDGGASAGAVYVIYGSETALSGTQTVTAIDDLTIIGEDASDSFGFAVAAGNLDGDSYSDIIVGAHLADSTLGAAYVFYGSATIAVTNASAATAKISGTGDSFTFVGEVITVGDVQNDGKDELMLTTRYSATDPDTPLASTGNFMYFGSSTRIASSVISSSSNKWFQITNHGDAQSHIGDVNGDGYDDVFIANGSENGAGTLRGGVYLFYGGPENDPFPSSPSTSNEDASWIGGLNNEVVGQAVYTADTNGDGYKELLISRRDIGGSLSGQLVIIDGQSAQFSGTSTLTDVGDDTILGVSNADQFAYRLNAGDFNNDGYEDVLIGAGADDTGANGAGAAYLAYFEVDTDGDGVTGTGGLVDGVDCSDTDATVSENQTYYADEDGDGKGDLLSTSSVCSSTPPNGYVNNTTDANDNDFDNDGSETGTDCNDNDSTLTSNITYYRDSDGDTLGDVDLTTAVCSNTAPNGYVSNSTDTNDTIANNGIEISGDTIDNDGDGDIDEVNTLESNGEHPGYKNSDPSSKDQYTNIVLTITAKKNGKILVKYADNSQYLYSIYDVDTDKETTVKSYEGKGYLLVVHPKAKKIALVNVYTGHVLEKQKLQDKNFKNQALKQNDFYDDGKTEAIVVAKKDEAVRITILRVKPKKDNKLKKLSALNVTQTGVKPEKTKSKKKVIELRKKDGTVLRTILVSKEYQLLEQT